MYSNSQVLDNTEEENKYDVIENVDPPEADVPHDNDGDSGTFEEVKIEGKAEDTT